MAKSLIIHSNCPKRPSRSIVPFFVVVYIYEAIFCSGTNYSLERYAPTKVRNRRSSIVMPMSKPADLAKIQGELTTAEQQVGSIIESFIELGVSVYDFPGTTEAAQGMITNLKRNVDRLSKLNQKSNDPASQLNNVNVPIEVVQYIEDGRNPDIYTREFVEAIRRSNQYQRAKMQGLKQLRDSLAEKIIEEFPDLESSVQNIVDRTTPR